MTAIRCLLCLVMVAGLSSLARADIYRWDTGEVIPGTEGIWPEPGLQLSDWNMDDHNLHFANFNGFDVSGSTFADSWLQNANFFGAVIANVDFSNALVQGAGFSNGFTLDQLYSTASYQMGDLSGVRIFSDLRGANFSHQNLRSAHFGSGGCCFLPSDLTKASFAEANLSGAYLAKATLVEANFEAATLDGADFSFADLTDANLAHARLDGTRISQAVLTNANFSSASLVGLDFSQMTLQRVNFSGADLTSANLEYATLDGADFTGAVIRGSDFSSTTEHGFTAQQLYSTASYRDRELSGIGLVGNDLSGWNFRDQDLTDARVWESDLTNADFSGAVIEGATFVNSLAAQQLYATASYAERDLRRIRVHGAMDGWNFTGQNLAKAELTGSLTGAQFRGADLRDAALYYSDLGGADFHDAIIEGVNFSYSNLSVAQLYSTRSYREMNLQRVRFSADLTRADLTGQDLTSAQLDEIPLLGADLSGANLTSARLDFSDLSAARFDDAIIAHASLRQVSGFTAEQLYSTWSYQHDQLAGVDLSYNELAGWDFSRLDLAGANFSRSDLQGADLRGANLANSTILFAVLGGADLEGADLRGAFGVTVGSPRYVNTIRRDGTIDRLHVAPDRSLLVRNHDSIAVYVQTSAHIVDGGTLEVRFDGADWHSLISFEPGIPVQLGGTLELTFADDVDTATQIGHTIRIFDWTGVEPTGAFTVSSLYPWNVSQLYTTGEVTLLLPGDTNGDHTVDLNDLNNVRNNFGGAGAGDTNNDGIVDLVDLNNVRNFFGLTAPQPVPEPATFAMACMAMATIGAVAWSRRKSARRV